MPAIMPDAGRGVARGVPCLSIELRTSRQRNYPAWRARGDPKSVIRRPDSPVLYASGSYIDSRLCILKVAAR